MNPEFKKKWVAALRSGKYKQGRMMLRNSKDGFCCLGVACDLFDPNGWEKDDRGMFFFQSEGRTNSSALTPSVVRAAGLAARDPIIQLPPDLKIPGLRAGHTTLSNINDQGATFDQIADIIEGLSDTQDDIFFGSIP